MVKALMHAAVDTLPESGLDAGARSRFIGMIQAILDYGWPDSANAAPERFTTRDAQQERGRALVPWLADLMFDVGARRTMSSEELTKASQAHNAPNESLAATTANRVVTTSLAHGQTIGIFTRPSRGQWKLTAAAARQIAEKRGIRRGNGVHEKA